MTTIAEARDTLLAALNVGWLANGTSAAVELQWDNVNEDPPTGVQANGQPVPYAALIMRHDTGSQDTLGDVGNRKFVSGGTLTWQIFTAPGDGHTLSDALVIVAIGLLRAQRSPAGVWLFDIVPIEVGVVGAWFQVNVLATFRYEEVA